MYSRSERVVNLKKKKKRLGEQPLHYLIAHQPNPVPKSNKLVLANNISVTNPADFLTTLFSKTFSPPGDVGSSWPRSVLAERET